MICSNCEQVVEDYCFIATVVMDGKEIQVVIETDAILCKECKAIAIQRAYEAMFK